MVGAVDCSQKKNTDVCRQYEIESYPQMLVIIVLNIFFSYICIAVR